VATNSLQIVATISGQCIVAANNLIISGHYALAANNVVANDQISCSEMFSWQVSHVPHIVKFISVLQIFRTCRMHIAKTCLHTPVRPTR
jgi:hypothetical protein